MTGRRLFLVLACAILMPGLGCGQKEKSTISQEPAAPPADFFDPARGTANITGNVFFEGHVPALSQVKMNADPVCMSLHKEPVTSDDLLVTDKRLANAFIYVKEGLEKYTFAVPPEPVTLSQDGCRYVPHVGGIMVNQEMRIVNNDPTLHNVRCMAERNAQFNLGQPVKGMETVRRFTNPEVMVTFRCDVHKWMSSYFGVLQHPYYSVTGKDGTFMLKGLPPGDYVIEAWHEKLGTKSQKVTVGDGETKAIRFEFKAY